MAFFIFLEFTCSLFDGEELGFVTSCCSCKVCSCLCCHNHVEFFDKCYLAVEIVEKQISTEWFHLSNVILLDQIVTDLI